MVLQRHHLSQISTVSEGAIESNLSKLLASMRFINLFISNYISIFFSLYYL